MKNNFAVILSLLMLALGSGCSIHKIDIQQGNIVSQEMMAQLKVGMKRDEIERLMGRPLVIDPFRHDRWDYIHSFKSGKDNSPRKQYRITLFFDGEQLTRIDSDIPPEGLPKR